MIVHIGGLSFPNFVIVMDWLVDTLGESGNDWSWYKGMTMVIFKNDSDALAFKLRFGV